MVSFSSKTLSIMALIIMTLSMMIQSITNSAWDIELTLILTKLRIMTDNIWKQPNDT